MNLSRFDNSTKVIGGNLSLLDSEMVSAAERRVAQLSDLATLISQRPQMITEDENRCEDFDALFDRGSIPFEAAEEAKHYLETFFASRLLSDKLAVCKFLADKLGWMSDFSLAALLGDSGGFRNLEKDPKIAYLKNAYSDKAFLIFSKLLGSPSVSYQTDFESVCEEVYYGRADMCILPLDSSRDAKLIGFCRLIDRFELKIVLTCDISSPDGGVTTRYALLRKNLAFTVPLPPESDTRFLELSFVPTEGIELADVLSAASSFGLKLYKVDAIPLSYSDNEFSYDVVFYCPDRSVEPFALYMALSAPQYETLGVYAHIKS